jgi:hypothetical protein
VTKLNRLQQEEFDAETENCGQTQSDSSKMKTFCLFAQELHRDLIFKFVLTNQLVECSGLIDDRVIYGYKGYRYS